MLLTLGIGSAVSLTGGIITIVCDAFPKNRRWVVTAVVCLCGFLFGLVYTTPVFNLRKLIRLSVDKTAQFGW